MRKLLYLMGLVFLTGCFNNNSDYSIVKPKNGKFHPIIMIKKADQKFGDNTIRGGNCTAFVINDKTAITAGHCMSVTKSYLEVELKPIIELAEKEVKRLKAMLVDLKLNCRGFHCIIQAQQLAIGIQMNERDLKIVKNVKVDEFTITTLDGKDTKIKAKSYYKDKRRDFGLIEGDFSKFNKIPVREGFYVKAGDVLKACGYVGANHPPVCIDFEAVGPYDFSYGGISMFVPGISGGPIIDEYGFAVGIASRMDGEFAMMEPLLGVISFKVK